MITTLVFCVCVTVLCCYAVHTVLADNAREQENTEVSRIMAEIDALSLKKSLQVTQHRKLPIQIVEVLHDTRRKSYLNVKPKRTQKKVLNIYPIIPSEKLSIGYGFDIRV
jgi:hypothetical protein